MAKNIRWMRSTGFGPVDMNATTTRPERRCEVGPRRHGRGGPLLVRLQRGDALLEYALCRPRFHTALSSAFKRRHIGTAASDANSAVGAIAGAASSAKTKIDISLIDFQSVIDANTRAIEALRKINGQLGNSGDIEIAIRELERQNQGLQQVKDGLQGQSDALGNDAAAFDKASGAMNDAIQGSVEGLGKTQKRINEEVMPRLSDGLDAFSSVSGDLVGVVRSLTPTIGQSISMLDQPTPCSTRPVRRLPAPIRPWPICRRRSKRRDRPPLSAARQRPISHHSRHGSGGHV
ncbi:MAG: hypothetical protein ACLTKG_04915 [Collinsella intestinalis]